MAERLDAAWLDTDDFYWIWGVEPYTEKRPVADRLELLSRVLDGAPRSVLSGSIGNWGEPLISQFSAVVFVVTPSEERLKRLRERERRRFGAAVEPGGARRRAHLDFLDWAARYDDPKFIGRSRVQHEAWLSRLTCPVLIVDGARATDDLANEVIARLGADSRP